MTCRGDTWYVHMVEPGIDRAVLTGVSKPRRATDLRTGAGLQPNWTDGTLSVAVHADVREELDNVIQLEGMSRMSGLRDRGPLPDRRGP